MTVISLATVPNWLDFLVMQPDEERAVVRDIVFGVLAFNAHGRGAPLQVSFPLYTDPKVETRGMLGPCVRVTGPAEKLYVLTLRHEVSSHLRAGRAMTLVRERAVVDAGRNERFDLLGKGAANDDASVRPLVVSGHSRLIEAARRLGATVRDEAVLVTRTESRIATDGAVDLLGFSDRKTVPVLR